VEGYMGYVPARASYPKGQRSSSTQQNRNLDCLLAGALAVEPNQLPLIRRTMSNATKWYVRLRRPNHPRADKQGLVKRSVLIMEEHIGRFLKEDEEIHHLNGIITDDRIENLQLTTHAEHRRMEKNIKNRYEMAKLRAQA